MGGEANRAFSGSEVRPGVFRVSSWGGQETALRERPELKEGDDEAEV